MKIVADESVDRQIVSALRGEGHQVFYIAEESPGIDDERVLQRSRDATALLLTADKDFGELIFRQRLLHSGVLLIRLAGLDSEAKAMFTSNAIELHGNEMKLGFAVLSPTGLRLRRLPLK